MKYKRLVAQALVVIASGAYYLFTPLPALATSPGACASGCGVCYIGSCPSHAVQDSWCGAICGGGRTSCYDCQENAGGCNGGDSGWWCSGYES